MLMSSYDRRPCRYDEATDLCATPMGTL